jgi:hypothetical protein
MALTNWSNWGLRPESPQVRLSHREEGPSTLSYFNPVAGIAKVEVLYRIEPDLPDSFWYGYVLYEELSGPIWYEGFWSRGRKTMCYTDMSRRFVQRSGISSQVCHLVDKFWWCDLVRWFETFPYRQDRHNLTSSELFGYRDGEE